MEVSGLGSPSGDHPQRECVGRSVVCDPKDLKMETALVCLQECLKYGRNRAYSLSGDNPPQSSEGTRGPVRSLLACCPAPSSHCNPTGRPTCSL